MILIFRVISRERHRVNRHHGRIVAQHRESIRRASLARACMHEQVVHVAVEHIVGVRDAAEEAVELRSIRDGLRIGQSDLGGRLQLLQIDLFLLRRLHGARHIAIIVGQRDVVDGELAAPAPNFTSLQPFSFWPR